jgi:hypothetical protein
MFLYLYYSFNYALCIILYLYSSSVRLGKMLIVILQAIIWLVKFLASKGSTCYGRMLRLSENAQAINSSILVWSLELCGLKYSWDERFLTPRQPSHCRFPRPQIENLNAVSAIEATEDTRESNIQSEKHRSNSLFFFNTFTRLDLWRDFGFAGKFLIWTCDGQQAGIAYN